MKRTLSLLGVAGLGAIVAVSAWRAGASGKPSPAAPCADTIAIENDLAALRSEVELLKRQPRFVLGAGPAVAPAAGDPGAAAAPPADPAEAGDALAAEAAREAASIRALDDRLDGDRWDHAWGRQISGAVTGALTATLPGSRVVDVRCGSAFCRVQVAHATPREQRDLADSLRDTPELETERFYRYDRTDGALVTALYLARPDQRLPLAIPD